MKIREMTGKSLDFVVLIALGLGPKEPIGELSPAALKWWIDNAPPYSTRWEYGGPILDEKRVSTIWDDFIGEWKAIMLPDSHTLILGPTKLIAGLRCFAISVLGEEVDMPEVRHEG